MMIRKRFIVGGALGVVLLACAIWMNAKQRQSYPVQNSKPPDAQRLSLPQATSPQDSPAGTFPKPAGAELQAAPSGVGQAVAVKVNDEPIYTKDLDAGINEDMFGGTLDQARDSRLNRMIDIVVLRQYLQKQGVDVPAAEVDKEIAELRKNPPAAGCSCCRYNSLEEFLSANMMTMQDLRAIVSNDLGLKRNVDNLWDKEYPVGEKRDAMLAKDRARIEQGYFKIFHVFYNMAQQPEFTFDPDKVREKANRKARVAWERLHKGEAFAKVAKSCSEDKISGAKGGDMGCIPRTAFGKEVERVVLQLKPGELGGPVESPWGIHIIRREQIADEDVLQVLREEFANRTLEGLLRRIRSEAKVEHMQPRAK